MSYNYYYLAHQFNHFVDLVTHNVLEFQKAIFGPSLLCNQLSNILRLYKVLLKLINI